MQSERDYVVLGDIDAPICRAHVLYQRWNGLTAYALGYPGTPSGLAMVDMFNGVIRIPYGTVSVELSGIERNDDAADGRVEFNVILHEKPIADANGEYWQVLDFAVAGLQGFERIPGLDEEFDQARCIETWDHDPAPFTITPTEIRNADGVLLKSRPEHEVHSLKGRASQNVHSKSPKLGRNKTTGKDITYTNVSRDTLRLPRRLLVDNRGNTARIEDVVLDGDQLKFKLPADFIKKAKYPVKHVTGLDPAYTQDMDYWDTSGYGTDDTWSDYDLYTNKGVPKGAVAEIIVANQEAGVEATLGIRTDGSTKSLNDIQLHEAESGGHTHYRAFVTCHATTGYVETYADDVSDANLFHVVGYWENVTWTEIRGLYNVASSGSWQTIQKSSGDDIPADTVCHVLMVNTTETGYPDAGCRNYGSSLDRRFRMHEAEGGGSTVLSMMVKTNSSSQWEGYMGSTSTLMFYVYGYFGSEMDWEESFVLGTPVGEGWQTFMPYPYQYDSQTDWVCIHHETGYEFDLGIRDGDDSTTERKLLEHEAESSVGNECVGFSMSARTNSSGQVHVWAWYQYTHYYRTGWFEAAGGAVTYTKTMDIDMLLRKTQTKTMTVDMLLQKTFSKTMDIDAIVKLRKTKTMDIDTLIQKTFEKGMDIDTLLRKGFTKEMLIDMLLRKTFTQTMDIDVLLQLRLLKTMDIDMLLEKRGVLKTMDIDLQLMKKQIEKTMDIDVVLMKQYTKTMDVDMLLRKTLAQTMDIDALLRKTFSKTMDIDVQVRKPGIEKTMAVDTLLRKTFTKTMSVDTLLRKTQQATMDIDAILQLPAAGNIAKIDGVLWDNIAAIYGVAKSGVAKVMGVSV